MPEKTSSTKKNEYSLWGQTHSSRHSSNRSSIGGYWPTRSWTFNTWFILACITAVATLLVLYGLTRSPVTWDDEVFYAEPSHTLALSGSLAAPMFFNIAGLSHYFFYQPPAYFLLMAGAYRIIGFNETAARLGSAVPYIAGIIVTFFLVRSIANRIGLHRPLSSLAGLLATFLIAFNEQSAEMARSGRADWFAVLLLFLGWLCVSRIADARTHELIWISIGFVLLLLAGLTHPALGAPAVGIIVAVIFRPSRLGLSRRTALMASLISVGLLAVPYGAWIMPHFGDWQAQLIHGVVASGSGNYGSFLSTQMGNVAAVLKYEPAILVVIIIGLAVFPWRASPDAVGALTGISIVAAGSTDSYMKFLLLIALIPAAIGLVLQAKRCRNRYRHVAVALIVLAAMNGFMFPALRAYEIHQFYRQRSPALVTANIERFVPPGSHLMGIPGVYFATVADGAEFRYSQVLYGVRWGSTADLQERFRRAVEQYKPTWFALPTGIQPYREYCYLSVRFRRVSTVNVQVSSGLNAAGQSNVAYVLWSASPDASSGCRT